MESDRRVRALARLFLAVVGIVVAAQQLQAVNCGNTCAAVGSRLQNCTNVTYSWCGNDSANPSYCGWVGWNDTGTAITCNDKGFWDGPNSGVISGMYTWFAFNGGGDLGGGGGGGGDGCQGGYDGGYCSPEFNCCNPEI